MLRNFVHPLNTPILRSLVILAFLVSGCTSAIQNAIYPGRFTENKDPSQTGATAAQYLKRQDQEQRQYFWIENTNSNDVVIYLHGNGVTARRVYDELGLQRLSHDVLILEYTGYATNSGTPSEKELTLDIQAAVAEAKRRNPKGNIIIVGSSLGGSAALAASPLLDVDAYFTISSFTSITDLSPFWAKTIVGQENSYDAEEKAQDIHKPWVITHCENDSAIPVEMAHRLYAANNNQEHTDLRVYPCSDHPVPIEMWSKDLIQFSKTLK